LINNLENIRHELSAAKDRIARTEFLAYDLFKKLREEEIIEDPRLDEIIGVLSSIVIELKNIRGKRME
jgi:hypothetical protein